MTSEQRAELLADCECVERLAPGYFLASWRLIAHVRESLGPEDWNVPVDGTWLSAELAFYRPHEDDWPMSVIGPEEVILCWDGHARCITTYKEDVLLRKPTRGQLRALLAALGMGGERC